jgi:thiol peroxidase
MADLRQSAVLWKGTPTDVLGPRLEVGAVAPSQFTLSANDLSDVPGTAIAGRARIVCAVPSLDTATCDLEMRRFNQEAGSLPGGKVYVVSMDLPFAQKRWCGATASANVEALSDFKFRTFGVAYGVFAPGKGLLVRAVFVIDKGDKLCHVEYVKEVASEPDYAAALTAAKALA